ncbi:hypothetical protein [Pseudomonas sp. PDM27]|uniref:hypothetical protein n=1 Tax=Pseudomonas sp. PDM27 TaxID=2854769 RepID=UPI001C45C3E5|nr:hypothetical protein [Pseudomonas sp. PDM27]MBV7569663.1 hypothetical protein [Pseudomonas sp. PDM27]
MTAHCIVPTKNPILTFEEQKSVLQVVNKARRQLERHQVDGCLIVNGIKCDWLLVDSVSGREIYIELKGSDIKHAVDQICATVAALTKNVKDIKLGYVICTKCPLDSTAVQRLKKSVLMSHKIKLKVQKTVHREDIEAMIA